LHAWVYRIARNAIVDYYRSPARRRELASGDVQDLATLETAALRPDEPIETSEAQQIALCLSPMIERLPETYREAIVKTELQGQTQGAAAASLGLSISGMKSRVQRARQQLKAMLLECCHVALDRRGAVIAHEPKDPGCGTC
jgi:RNA polymerase sigma-70 factor (ECF subfamily)